MQVLKAPTELEILQQEVAKLKEAFQAVKRQTDALLLALAFSFLGGIGMNAAFSAASGHRMVRRVLLIFGSMPLGAATILWLLRC